MEVKFGQNEQPVTPVAETTTTTPAPTPAATTPTAVATQKAMPVSSPAGFVLGDKIPDFSEVIVPRINIVQNIGQLKDSFESGAIVYNQQHSLFVPPLIDLKTGTVERAATPPVIITVLGFRPTRYSEKTTGGARGIIVNTEAEVRAQGGTLDYAEWKLKVASGMKRFEPLADAFIAIERPESFPDDDTVFGYDVDGKKVALALWAMKGTAYTAAAKRVFFTGRSMGILRGGYPTWAFSFATREESYDTGNKAWVPVCLPARKQTPIFLDFVRSVLTAPAQEAAPAQE
jgi:hypothetical protein